ncbi:MAG: hypothetical protein MJH10_16235 [Epibacterium sp.]|nr:hypothetical protein [Epibacterium sp.]
MRPELKFAPEPGTGNDTINGGGGDDVIDGGDGHDVIRTHWGDDKVKGGSGNDTIHIESWGDKRVEGGDGNDNIHVSSNQASGSFQQRHVKSHRICCGGLFWLVFFCFCTSRFQVVFTLPFSGARRRACP